jgi:hypothetical protein
MDGAVLLSAQRHRDLALRWRRLAADATTPQLKYRLLALASECAIRADGLISIDEVDREDAE